MSSFIIVTAGRNDGTRDLAIVHDLLTSPEAKRALMKTVGLRAEQELRGWFFQRDASSPNKHGWPRQHFWSRIGKRTAYDPAKTTDASATVVVSDPALAAKINGATIRATGAISPATGKPTQNISIPLKAEVYGAWPRGNPVAGLFFIRKRDGDGGFLVAREGDALVFYYRLKPEVIVPKDPDALPKAARLGAALSETAKSFFRRHGTGGAIGGSSS